MENQTNNAPIQAAPKNNKPIIIALIAIGAVVVIGIVIGIFFAIKGLDPDSTVRSGTTNIKTQNAYLDDAYKNPSAIKELKISNLNSALGYSSDGSKIAILTDENILSVYDTATLKSVKQIENVASCAKTGTTDELACSIETTSDNESSPGPISSFNDLLSATKTDSELKIFSLDNLSFSDTSILGNLPRQNDKALSNTVDSIDFLGSDDSGSIWQIKSSETFTDISALSEQEQARVISGFGIHSINHQSLLKIKDGKVTWIREINSEQTPGCGLADNNSKILCLSEGGIGDPSTVRVYDQKSGDELFSKEITGHVTVTNQGWVVDTSSISDEIEFSMDLSSAFDVYDFAGNKSSAKSAFTSGISGPFPSAAWLDGTRVAYDTDYLLSSTKGGSIINAKGNIVAQTSIGSDAVQRIKSISGYDMAGMPVAMTADGEAIAVIDVPELTTGNDSSDPSSISYDAGVAIHNLKSRKQIAKFTGSQLMISQNGVLWCTDYSSVSMESEAIVSRVFVAQK